MLWKIPILNLQEKVDFFQDVRLVLGIKFFEQIYQLGVAFVRMLPEHFPFSGLEPVLIYIERGTYQLNEPIVNFSFLYFDSRKVSA
jgi:hypothetical protein